MTDDFITQVPTGKGPDATITANDGVGKMVQSGVIAPLELGDTASSYEPITIKAFTYQGKIYGVPYATENIALLRNTKLAPTAPKTYEEMVQMGKASGAQYPFLVGLDPQGADPYHLYPWQMSFGAPVFNQAADGSYDPTKLAMGGPNGDAFATWLAAQGKAGLLNLNISQDISKDTFYKGGSPFLVTGPWSLGDIKKNNIPYAIDPIPTAAGKDATPFVGVQGFVMSSKTTNAVATQKFLVEYVGQESVQTALYKALQRPPANKAAFAAAKSDADVAAFGAVGANGVAMPNVPAMGAVWTDWGQTEAAIIGQKAPDPVAAWEQMITTIQAKM